MALTRQSVTLDDVTTVIVVTLVLLGIGIVFNELLRLKRWLKRPPPSGEDAEPSESPT